MYTCFYCFEALVEDMAIHTKQKKKSDREDYLAFHHFILEFLFVRSFINGNLDALLRCAFLEKGD